MPLNVFLIMQTIMQNIKPLNKMYTIKSNGCGDRKST